jgi:FkbM family methyltransferase
MNFFEQKLNGLKWRLKCFSYGILYLRHKDFKIPGNLRINGIKKKIKFIDVNNGGFRYEFIETCLNDSYHLKEIKKRLKHIDNIVDIGANQGLFTIAARKHFSKASITCYEPNKQLKQYLDANAATLNAKVFYEAVTKEDCKVQLQFGETDLHTTTLQTKHGEVTGISFRKVIARGNGKIDLVKMDCEGGEWEILEDKDAWKNIRSLTMEYHLWAKPNSNVNDLFKSLERLNFEVIFHTPLTKTFGLLTAIKKDD